QFRLAPWTYRPPWWQADDAVIPEGGTSHVRHGTAGVRGAARRCGGRVGARGARTAGGGAGGLEGVVMTNKLRLVPAIAGLVAWLLTPTSAQSVDQSFYYKLSTQFRGNGMKLDVFNGGPKNNLTRLEPDQDVSGQFWRFVGNGDGTFRLSTLFRGPDMCLDIFNGGANNNQPHL